MTTTTKDKVYLLPFTRDAKRLQLLQEGFKAMYEMESDYQCPEEWLYRRLGVDDMKDAFREARVGGGDERKVRKLELAYVGESALCNDLAEMLFTAFEKAARCQRLGREVLFTPTGAPYYYRAPRKAQERAKNLIDGAYGDGQGSAA